VEKHLDQHWSEWFGDLLLNHEEDGTTTLTGVVGDQSALHGLLATIRDLGLTLISVALVDPARGSDPHGDPSMPLDAPSSSRPPPAPRWSPLPPRAVIPPVQQRVGP
jgi:hypothetical protein